MISEVRWTRSSPCSLRSNIAAQPQHAALLGHLLAGLFQRIGLGQVQQIVDRLCQMAVHCLPGGLWIAGTQCGDDLSVLTNEVTTATRPRPAQSRRTVGRLLAKPPQVLHRGTDGRIPGRTSDRNVELL